MDCPKPRGCVVVVLESSAAGSGGMGLGSACQTPWAKVITCLQRDSPTCPWLCCHLLWGAGGPGATASPGVTKQLNAQMPCKPHRSEGTGLCTCSSVSFSAFLPFKILFAFIVQQISPSLAQAPATPRLAMNRLSFLLLKIGFPDVERLNLQKCWEGGWLC